MKASINLFMLTFLLPAVTNLSAQTGHITNVHDPCIIKCGDYYYVYCTGDRIPIRRSRDLVSWQRIGDVFQDIPAWGKQEVPGVSNIWAPDISFHDSTYYLYYSLSTFGSNRSCIGRAINKTLDPDDPDYKWVDQGKVIESQSSYNYNAIDPNIAVDEGGKIWLSFGSFWSGIKLVELDKTTMKPPATPRLNSIASRGGDAIEAPFIIFKDDYFYLLVSFDLCCRGANSTYKIMVGRSEKITGPYIDKDRLNLMNGGGSLLLAGDDRWRGPGHCAVLQAEDADWLVYHAYDATANGRATLRIARLYWDADDWPTLEQTAPVFNKIDQQPAGFSLYQNYPNPFNASTTISFELDKSGHAELVIYDLNGQSLSTLINSILPSGRHIVPFDGSFLATGIYWYSLRTNSQRVIKKMIAVN